MKNPRNQLASILLAAYLPIISVMAQSRGGSPEKPVVSPEVSPDRQITFRIHAPKAEAVKLSGPDIPGNGKSTPMTKGANGVWEMTIGPIDPGAYHYEFNLDGAPVVDPQNPATSGSRNHVWSLVVVPGSDFMDTRQVPHGAVAAVTYYSTALQCFRRLHVYTPPGYETGKGKFPVFYLLHGSGDCDEAWTSVGRAGFILDNLLAAGKAKPMVVVMPAGHTEMARTENPRSAGDAFAKDFLGDIMPLVEKNYRVYPDRAHRAIAGLSMGGAQTLDIGISHLNQFAYLGVFSSGVLEGMRGSAPKPAFEERNRQMLADAKLKKGLKLFWFATGKDDFLVQKSRATVELFKRHDFNVVYRETDGAHTWVNWRNYLNEFAPQLFQ